MSAEQERPPQLDPALVNEFVSKAHGDLDAHGIPLLVHAQQGGEQAQAVVELLEGIA